MKKIRYHLTAIALLSTLAACNNAGSSTAINSRNGETTISFQEGKSTVEIKHAGDIKLNDNETAIASISPGGFLRYSNNGRELLAKGEDNGAVIYTLRENGGQLNANDAAGQRFIAQMLREMHNYGYNLVARRDALYQAGGQQAVLREVAGLKNDELKETSLDYLLKKVNPATEPEQFAAVLNASDSIRPDNTRARFLDKVSSLEQKTDEQWMALIESASRINATAEKTNLLIGIGQKMPRTDAVKAAYMKAAKTITAEAEYARVVSTIK